MSRAMVWSRSSGQGFLRIIKKWRSSRESYSPNTLEMVAYEGPKIASNYSVYCLFDDYYDVLGVERHASKETIKAAYHTRARLWHPDKNADSEQSKEKFVQLQRAYAVLSDPHKRAIYDRLGAMGLDVAERYSEDQRTSMKDIAGDSKWAILLMCIGLFTCCYCCYCCFGCCSMCRRSTENVRNQRREECKRKERRSFLDLDSMRTDPTEISLSSLFAENIQVKGIG